MDVLCDLWERGLFLQYGSQQIRSWFEVIDIPKFHMILGRDLINTLQLFPDTPTISTRVCPPKPIQVAAPGSGTPEELTPQQRMRNATLLNIIKGWMEDHEQRVPMGGVCTHPAGCSISYMKRLITRIGSVGSRSNILKQRTVKHGCTMV